MNERLSLVEKRVGQLEHSLSTAIHALTELLQAREEEKIEKRANPLTSSQQLSAVQKDNVRLSARVQILEGYMKAVLAFVNAQDSERSTRRDDFSLPLASSPVVPSSGVNARSNAESPILEERVVGPQPQRASSQPQTTTAGSMVLDGHLDRFIDAHARAPVARPEQRQVRPPAAGSSSPAVASVSAMTEAETAALLREVRDVALEVVEGALTQEREVLHMELRGELSSFRDSWLREVAERARSAAAVDVAYANFTEVGESAKSSVKERTAAARPSVDALSLSKPLLVQATPSLSAHKGGSSTTVKDGVEELADRVAALEAASKRDMSAPAHDEMHELRTFCQELAVQVRSLDQQVASLTDGAGPQSAGPQAPTAGSGEEREIGAPLSGSAPQQLRLRREITALVERRIQKALMDLSALQDDAMAQQEVALMKLQEDQIALRGAVRTLVTPSAVLQALDHRLRALREDVMSLQHTQKQGDSLKNPPLSALSSRSLVHTVASSPSLGAPLTKANNVRDGLVENENIERTRRPDLSWEQQQQQRSRPFKVPQQHHQQQQRQSVMSSSESARHLTAGDLVNSRDQVSVSSSLTSSASASVTETSLDTPNRASNALRQETARQGQQDAQGSQRASGENRLERRPPPPLPLSTNTFSSASGLRVKGRGGEGLDSAPARRDGSEALHNSHRQRGGGAEGGGYSSIAKEMSVSSVSSAASRNVSLDDALRGAVF